MIVAILIGIAFGFALERAGLGNARKLAGQFYFTDFTVFKVMFSAILVAMLGAFWLGRLGIIDLRGVYVPETFLAPQLIGGLLFGAGFAIAGLCPGTSCVALATGRGDGLAVVIGMFAGVLITGFESNELSLPPDLQGKIQLLEKPFTADDIGHLLAETFERATTKENAETACAK